MLAILSPTDPTPKQIEETNDLFEAGLQSFILRLPGKEPDDYVDYLFGIDRKYHSRIFIPWAVRDLAVGFPIGGFYLKFSEAKALTEDEKEALLHHRVIVGCHSSEEIQEVPIPVSFFLLSPVFDSISKSGYRANPKLLSAQNKTVIETYTVLAMGGVTPENYTGLFEKGYSGAAVIGSVWDDPLGAVHAFGAFPKPAILSIAGHDPSGGAGIDADRETAEHYAFRCFAVPTVVTTQDEGHFDGFTPISEETVLRSIRFLLTRHPEIRGIKIGMIPSLTLLHKILDTVNDCGIFPIVWDPIVAASKGNEAIIREPDKKLLRECLDDLDFVTPNTKEYEYWFDEETVAGYSGVVLKKSEARDGNLSDVVLFNGERVASTPAIFGGEDRHGTGCRYSSAVLCERLLGHFNPLSIAQRAQEYVHAYRVSSASALRFDPYSRKREALQEKFRVQYVTNNFSVETIRKVLEGGVRWVQLRMKGATTEERILALRSVRPICDRYGAVLIMDDDVEAARKGGADGVHLGKTDMSPAIARRILGDCFIIGSTVNDEDMLLNAYAAGADYAGVGPYRFTQTKKNLDSTLGVKGLQRIWEQSLDLNEPFPLVAIGGITVEAIREIKDTGVFGIALSGAIERAKDITHYCQRLVTEWEDLSQIDR